MTRSQPAIILTLQRTGGSFLAFCLSNHPDVFCVRGEPLGNKSMWAKAGLGKLQLLELLLLQPNHAVGICKLMDNHALRPEVWTWLNRQYPPVKVLYLKRKDLLAQAVSHEINRTRCEGHPTHVFSSVNPPPVTLDPTAVLERCRTDMQRYRAIHAALADCELPQLRLTYQQITGGKDAIQVPHRVAQRICNFLEVPFARLYTRMRKVHRRPLAETVTNWDEVCTRLRDTDFERFV